MCGECGSGKKAETESTAGEKADAGGTAAEAATEGKAAAEAPPTARRGKKGARPAEYPERTKRTCARSNRERSNYFGFRLTDSEKITIFV